MDDLSYGLTRQDLAAVLDGGDPESVALEIRTAVPGPGGTTLGWVVLDAGGEYVRDERGEPVTVESVVPSLPLSVRPGTTMRFINGQWTPSNVM